MKRKIFCKTLVIGIMLLFIGSCTLPGFGAAVQKNTPVQPLFEGSSYFILLSDYADGAGADNKWAVQLRFDSALMVVESEFDAITLPLILDQWVEIRVEIDLDGDWMEIYYDDEFLIEKEWTAGPNNGMDGILNIGAVDLFAYGATSVYYDDLSLEEVGVGVIWSDNFDSYADGSSMHGQGGWKGWDNDPTWTAYVTSVKSQSNPHSVDIKADADLVHEYEDLTSGYFIYTAWQYIPLDIGDPPGAPTIEGPSGGAPDTAYDFDFTAIDPDGDDVKYHIDWGDGTDEWTLFGASGTPVTASHSWAEKLEYTITAYAQDSKGLDGPEETFVINIPRSRNIFNTFFLRILEHFPILKNLLGL